MSIEDLDENESLLKNKKSSNNNSEEIRWIILIIVSLIFLVRSYGVTCFATVNDVTSEYFHILPSQTDLLSTVIFVAKALTCVFVAIISEKLTLRILTLSAAIAVCVGNLLVATAISSRTNYPIAVIGQSLNGLAAAALNTVPALVAIIWFPSGENGVALSIPWAASRISLALSGIISTHTFVLSKREDLDEDDNAKFSPSYRGFSDETFTSFQKTFQITFFTLSGIAILTYTLANVYVSSKIPSEIEAKFAAYKEWNLCEQLKAIFELFKQFNFVALTVTNLLLLSIKPMVTVLLSSMVLKKFPKLNDRTPGEIFCIASLVGSLGGPLAGYVLDKFNKLKITALVGGVSLVISCSLVVCAFWIRKILMLYFALTLVVFFREFTFVSITKVLMTNVSSKNKLRLASVFMTIPLIAVMGYAYAIRALLKNGYVILASAFPLPFICIVVILVACIRTNDAAVETETIDETEQ